MSNQIEVKYEDNIILINDTSFKITTTDGTEFKYEDSGTLPEGNFIAPDYMLKQIFLKEFYKDPFTNAKYMQHNDSGVETPILTNLTRLDKIHRALRYKEVLKVWARSNQFVYSEHTTVIIRFPRFVSIRRSMSRTGMKINVRTKRTRTTPKGNIETLIFELEHESNINMSMDEIIEFSMPHLESFFAPKN